MKLDYLPKEIREGHMPPTEAVINLWKQIRNSYKYQHLFEIGLNAGHSSAIQLELFPDLKITSLDVNRHSYTQVAANTLKSRFGDRFDFIGCHSRVYFDRLKSGEYEQPKVDAVFIDGGHDALSVLNDIAMSKWLGVKDIFVDDTNTNQVNRVCKTFLDMGIMSRIESYSYKCATTERNSKTKKSFTDNEVTHFRFS